MIKLKTKEKLLNRRDELEVEEMLDSSGAEIKFEELSAWVEEMKEMIGYDEEVGELQFLQPSTFNDEVGIGGINVLVDKETYEPFFPDLTDQAGKAVVVNDDEDGFDYTDLPQAGTKLYKHDLGSIQIVDNDSTAITSDNLPTRVNALGFVNGVAGGSSKIISAGYQGTSTTLVVIEGVSGSLGSLAKTTWSLMITQADSVTQL